MLLLLLRKKVMSLLHNRTHPNFAVCYAQVFFTVQCRFVPGWQHEPLNFDGTGQGFCRPGYLVPMQKT